MNIGFVGCVTSSSVLLEKLLTSRIDNARVTAAITKKSSDINSDFVDLSVLCKKHEIPFHYEENNKKSESISFMKKYCPDVIYCFGWSHLLGCEMLSLPELGVIGFHPAPLPIGRGRHPVIWALSLGLKETASTFFKINEGIDAGPVLSQKYIPIEVYDNAASLYRKILCAAAEQIIDFTEKLVCGGAVFKPQNELLATYWRKRTKRDGLIDWRMDAEEIYNLIRALSKPYPGAGFIRQDQHHHVWSASINHEDTERHVEPGHVLVVEKNRMLIKCGGVSSIWIYDIPLIERLRVGEYL